MVKDVHHHRIDGEMRDILALYALGLLTGDELAALESHLSSGCPACDGELRAFANTAAAIAEAGPLHHPPPGLRERVMQVAEPAPQAWRQWSDSSPADLHVVREGEGLWQQVRAGVYAKQLYVDRSRDLVTMLIRMDPGSSYVPHRHAAPEQCFVLEGDISDGQRVFHAGDYQCAAQGSRHGTQTSQGGCLLLIVSSLHDELI